MRLRRCWMRSDFVAEKLKKAKWVLTKNLEISQDRQKAMEPEVPKRKSWWHRLKLRIFGL